MSPCPILTHHCTVMSTPNLCLPSNPDTTGIGVRTAIYAQNLLSFIPALFALQDGKVTPLELEAMEAQSTTILITAFALLLSVIAQALQHGLTNYHAAIILNLSWMNNTNLFIYFFLYAYHTFELMKDEEMKPDGDLRAFWVSRRKKTMRNPVLIIGSLHLSLMSAVGTWLWAKPIAFGNSPPCSLSASLFVVGQRASIGSQGLRGWSLLIYSLLLVPGLNLIAPIGFFAAPIWVLGRFFSFSLKRESMLRFARAGLAVLAIMNAILLVDTEVAISKNQDLTAKGDGDWTFGQTLALLLLLIPIRDIGEALLERRAKTAGERLKTAAETGNLGMAREAIKSGASRSAIEYMVMIALKESRLDFIKTLIENPSGGEPIYPSLQAALTAYCEIGMRNIPGWNALHHAVKQGHTEMVKLLGKLEAGPDLQNMNGWTALHLAAMYGHTEIVKVLAELKADPNLPDKNRWTALHLAAMYGHTEIVKVLAELKADPNLQNKNRWTALHLAAMYGHTEIVKVLAELKADPNLQNKNRWTALYLAAMYGHTEIVKVLAELKADPNLPDKNRWTALHLAAMYGHTEIVKVLAELKADPNLQNKNRWTALYLAAMYGHTEIVKVLAELKADPNLPDKYEGTALHLAARNGHTEIVKVLAELKADPNLPEEDGWTALHLAASNGHTEIVKVLAELKADPNLPDKNRWTALHLAAMYGHTEIVKVLAELKADPNLPDKDGETALHLATSNGHTEIVKVLAELKADPNLSDKNGWTALHYATKNEYVEIAKFLTKLQVNLE
ncbi:hypothetical protein D9756_011466 [Leucocoprinus leucothites]|uniref:Uncharacterized protein n=1 Tax=Leucocoprinus leucothites TaxID=201217 RepID=A0A8H5CNI2_9AGAR|nr:hypothetical protein D9756_011466 [Leucoagaricus leucothites]